MKINHTKTIKILKPYLITAILFIAGGYILNTIETFSFCSAHAPASFSTIITSYFNITAVFCLYSAILLLFYLLVGLLNQKIAQIAASVLFSILVLLEIGLFIYSQQTGSLMGRELIIRPISETLVTIRNSSDITIDVILIIAVTTCFIVLPFLLRKVKKFNNLRFLTMGVAIIGIFSVCTLFYQRDENRTINNYVESKSFHFFSAITSNLTDESDPELYEQGDIFIADEKGIRIEKNETLLKDYLALYPNRTISNLDYPMERPASEIPDVLSPYFKKSEKQPNIVIVIVESLGNYLMGEKGGNVSFTPFLDSLANVGLYWKNCLSTSPRTYAVLPSVVGSLPHGMRGFQFGIMPQHHSLFSILKNNDYSTNFFYGGDTNFDSMLDFLTIQEPDHIDNFMPQIKTFKNKKQANWWGLHDHVLFDESFDYLKTFSNQKPNANVYLTLTTHESFNSKEDKKLKEYYGAKTEKVFSKLDLKQRDYFLPIKDKIAVFIYTDDCMRDFINDYSKRPDFENTIFIITGDHSISMYKNNLAYYSVPLIIWSPLLETHQKFPNIVSHLAITPSIISFLQNNYNLKAPDKLSWCSDGLDTSSVFNPSEKVLFLSYERRVNVMVYDQYFFEDKTEWNNRRVHEINENLDLEQIYDSTLMEDIYSKFKILKYIDHYVYHNDKLITDDSHSGNEYTIIRGYKNEDTIICKTPDTIPSIHGIDVFDILPVQKIESKYNKIKIKLMADIIINDSVYQDQQMRLKFICSGKDYQYASNEHITKYIADDPIAYGKKYDLLIEKEIDVNNVENISVHICVTTNEYDSNWKPNKKITISNIRVLMWGK